MVYPSRQHRRLIGVIDTESDPPDPNRHALDGCRYLTESGKMMRIQPDPDQEHWFRGQVKGAPSNNLHRWRSVILVSSVTFGTHLMYLDLQLCTINLHSAAGWLDGPRLRTQVPGTLCRGGQEGQSCRLEWVRLYLKRFNA